MSYCSFAKGESDVYLWGRDLLGCWICQSCRLAPELIGGFYKADAFVSLKEVKAHLEAHQAAGHLVPDYAFERIEREMKVEAFSRKHGKTMRSSLRSVEDHER